MARDCLTLAKSKDFHIRIVILYQYLCEEKREYVLSKQLLRKGTSIGAISILDMIEPMNVKDGILYTFDSDFKSTVDDILAAKKRQKSKQLMLF